jgi:ferredoxin-NADP reductase
MSKNKQYPVQIKSIDHVTHDTLRIITGKPDNYLFKPGQATDVAISQNGEGEEKRPFTFASLPENEEIEFIIKTYPSHEGLTDKLLDLRAGDKLVLHEVFGSITYKGEGCFIAGGAGITPFIAIFRQLKQNNAIGNNHLIFANKTEADIILKEELQDMLGNQFINILSEEKSDTFARGFITEEFLSKHIHNTDQYFYLCGPEPMMKAVEAQLDNLGISRKQIVKEGW